MHLLQLRPKLGRTRIAAVVLTVVAAPLAAVSAAGAACGRGAATSCPWVNSSAPISTRVSELMAQMSLAQKVAMMTGVSGSSYVGNIPAISSLCIPAMNLEDGPAGVGDGMSNVTQLPAPVDVASTWDTAAEQEYGQVIGAEQAAKGTTVDLGPTINIVRDPRWGRAFESIGEDPYQAGQIGAADIRGVQSAGTMAQVKHYAVYNQETNRNTSERQRGRQHPGRAGDLPARLPGRGAAGRGLVGDVLLQLDQRHRRLPEPDHADHGAAPAARLHRLRHLGLGRDALDGGVGERRPGHGHARQRRVLRHRADECRQRRDGEPVDDQLGRVGHPDPDVRVRSVRQGAERVTVGDRDEHDRPERRDAAGRGRHGAAEELRQRPAARLPPTRRSRSSGRTPRPARRPTAAAARR